MAGHPFGQRSTVNSQQSMSNQTINMEAQTEKLAGITGEEWRELVRLCREAEEGGSNSEAFSAYYHKVCDMGLVFPFDWMMWEPAGKAFKDQGYDYTTHNLLEL